MASIFNYSIQDRFLIARKIGKYLADPVNYTVEEMIAASERAFEENSGDWIVNFVLGDYYAKAGRYAESLEICQRCVKIKPNDIRSAYALATAYNTLARASFDVPAELLEAVQYHAAMHDEIFDPALSKAELEKAGLTLEVAATQAIRWFERALLLKPDRASRAQIEWDIATLYKRFPNLRF